MAVISKINFAVVADTLYADDILQAKQADAFIGWYGDSVHKLFFMRLY
jgi:hypothetical protein